MKERIQKQVQEAKLEPAEETESEDNSLVWGIITLVLAVGSFWAYFNGNVLAIRRVSLGEYSFLVVGILFVLVAAYNFYEHFTKKSEEEKK